MNHKALNSASGIALTAAALLAMALVAGLLAGVALLSFRDAVADPHTLRDIGIFVAGLYLAGLGLDALAARVKRKAILSQPHQVVVTFVGRDAAGADEIAKACIDALGDKAVVVTEPRSAAAAAKPQRDPADE